jgi:hypothetical protein
VVLNTAYQLGARKALDDVKLAAIFGGPDTSRTEAALAGTGAVGLPAAITYARRRWNEAE